MNDLVKMHIRAVDLHCQAYHIPHDYYKAKDGRWMIRWKCKDCRRVFKSRLKDFFDNRKIECKRCYNNFLKDFLK